MIISSTSLRHADGNARKRNINMFAIKASFPKTAIPNRGFRRNADKIEKIIYQYVLSTFSKLLAYCYVDYREGTSKNSKFSMNLRLVSK